ncbi:hypothetical protein TWF569_004571 [Orbilia oligospora]|uniref:Uncharacterized protein n=2 Tax=Orbilia oligospora TaxID=2813651 RepID=A0A7C8N5G2_ORBOL|nr:hypothetical protein TWF102_008324 [Orbilia oligospora]KAF3093710.1 hypothetical protein TWF103_010772 [Orbilia oligospora]KAF3114898.1 hypothetical protein TWF706_007052 [Orbilia oligospora]KAF3114900.1 hypothetical protein TWF706_007052 [Orbilia oligospora]KAF3144317.1 hypothetical protein TWF594_004847 [Orbilia oligospora]
MPPKKNKNRKRNSVVQIPKENGDADSSLNSPAVETPMTENQEFITPADRLDNPLDKPLANGAATTDSIDKGAMAKAEGEEAVAAWGLDDDKGKGIVGEPDAIPDTAEKLENGSADHKPAEVNGDGHKGEDATVEEANVEKPKDEGPDAEGPKDGEPESKEPEAEAEDPKIEEPESKIEDPKDDIPDTKAEDPSEEERKLAPPVDLDVPDTADAKEYIPEEPVVKKAEELVADEHAPSKSLADELAAVEAAGEEEEEESPVGKATVEEPEAEKPTSEEISTENPAGEEPTEPASTEEKTEAPAPEESATAVKEVTADATAPVEDAPEAKAEEPGAVQDAPALETTAMETAPEGDTILEEKTTTEAQTVPEVEATAETEAAPEPTAEPAPEEPVVQKRPIMEPPKPTTLASLTSTDRDFTSTRYQSTTSPQFLNKPHQAANHSLDLDDRNMQSSVNNWYKKIFSFADSLNWRPGWDHLEEFDHLVKSTEAALSQISLLPAQEWWAEKPKDISIDWDNIDEAGAKYEEFWEWKSKIALSGILANFACREIFGKTVFGLDDKMTRKLGLAMSVFTTDFGDDITATKFRHMTLKLLQESRSFGSSSRKQLVKLSQELANVLSPLTPFFPVKEPQTDEEKQQQAHYTPLTLALYEKVLLATHTLHDTIQKDYKYYALFHPVPGVEFDETTMEESTFQGIGAGRGAVSFVARPGLARLGLPRGGEPEDIIIVHKALVVREDALEEGLKHFDPSIDEAAPEPPAEEPSTDVAPAETVPAEEVKVE